MALRSVLAGAARRLRGACAGVLMVVGVSDPAAFASETAVIKANVISQFRVGSSQTRFGKLEFVGGLELSSQDALFGAWSSIVFLPGAKRFLGVLDTGHWLTGEIRRDETGRLSGLSDLTITSMIDANGRAEAMKRDMDAEGVTIRGDRVLVSFERLHRVDAYPLPGFETSRPLERLPILIPRKNLLGNGGLETIATSPTSSPLGGAIVVVAEKSLDEAGNMYAAILDGKLQGQFTVRRHDGFDATDGAFLPDGDMLLLERRFTLASGAAMRIRRIRSDDIRPGAVVDGEELIRADFNEQIDNMEGIDVIPAADGSQHIILVSDDNHSFLQRSLMLEFRLAEDG